MQTPDIPNMGIQFKFLYLSNSMELNPSWEAVSRSENIFFCAEELLDPSLTAQVGVPPLVGCRRLLIQYSYPLYLHAVSIRYPTTPHAVMPHKISYTQLKQYFIKGP
jgi:hypothetical protein